MRIFLRSFTFAFLLVVSASRLAAFGAAGAASSPYLKLPMGARGTAMGEAFTGIANDVQAMYYNAAGLTQVENAQLILMHNESFGGIRYENIGFAVPAEKVGLDIWGSIGFSYTLVAIEDIPRTRILPGTPDTYDQAYADRGFKFTSGASTVGFSYAWQATKLYSIGGTLKFLNEKVDTIDGWGIAGDFGLLSKLDMIPGLQAGMTIQNVGTSPTHAPLPISLRVGLGHVWAHPFSDPDVDDDKLTTGLDFLMPIVPVDGAPHINFGTEYFHWFGHSYGALRVGYRFPTDLGALAGLTAGGGFGFQGGGNDFNLDYTFVPYGELGAAHRIALTSTFGTKPRVIHPHAKGPLRQVTGLKAVPGDAQAALSWDESPVRADAYNVYMSYNPAGGQWYRIKSHNGVQTTVLKLYNGYTMYFAVTSIRKRGDGTWEEGQKSEPVMVKPVAPGGAGSTAAPMQPQRSSAQAASPSQPAAKGGAAAAAAAAAQAPKSSQQAKPASKPAALEPPQLP